MLATALTTSELNSQYSTGIALLKSQTNSKLVEDYIKHHHPNSCNDAQITRCAKGGVIIAWLPLVIQELEVVFGGVYDGWPLVGSLAYYGETTHI